MVTRVLAMGLVVSLVVAVSANDRPGSLGTEAPKGEAGEERIYQRREGSKLSQAIGEFMVAGERVQFTMSDGSGRFTVLENLALERVIGQLEKSRTPPRWSVTGMMTEFQGANFLMITHAEIRSGQLGDVRSTRSR